MPRKARLIVPGAVHHVMSRGIDARPIFRHEKDKYKLLSLIEKNIQKSGYLLYAWSFMDNHYHLALRINNYSFKKFMGAINGPYAQYFRKKLKTRGSLFQDRPKTIVCQDQNYLQELIRYIHLNPIRAGQIKSLSRLATYKWTGHSVLMGKNILDFQNCVDILRRFSRNTSVARKAYEQFCLQGVDSENDDFTLQMMKINRDIQDNQDTGSFVIGNPEFVKKVLNEAEEIKQRLSRASVDGITIENIAAEICKQEGVEIRDLLRKGRANKLAQVKASIASVAHQKYQIPVVQIASYFNVSPPAVSYLLRS